MVAEVMLDRRGAQGHVQRLLHVQGAWLAVRPHTAVIVHTVGHVGVLLYLGNDNALANGVQRAAGIKKQSPLCTGTAFNTSVRVLFLMRSSNSALEISWSKP